MRLNNLKTFSTMMKTADYCHTKTASASKDNLNFQIFIISQLYLFLIHNKDYIKNYNSQATGKNLKILNISYSVINLNREIFLYLKDNYQIQLKVFMKKKKMIFQIRIMILDLKKLFMTLSNKKQMFLMVCYTEVNIVGRINQVISLLQKTNQTK